MSGPYAEHVMLEELIKKTVAVIEHGRDEKDVVQTLAFLVLAQQSVQQTRTLAGIEESLDRMTRALLDIRDNI